MTSAITSEEDMLRRKILGTLVHNPPLLLLLHPALLPSSTIPTTTTTTTIPRASISTISIRTRIICRTKPSLTRRLELHVHLAFGQVAFAEEAGGDPAADQGDEEDDRHYDPLVVGLDPARLLVLVREGKAMGGGEMVEGCQGRARVARVGIHQGVEQLCCTMVGRGWCTEERDVKSGEKFILPCAVILDSWSFGRGSRSGAGSRSLGAGASRGSWSAGDGLLNILHVN